MNGAECNSDNKYFLQVAKFEKYSCLVGILSKCDLYKDVRKNVFSLPSCRYNKRYTYVLFIFPYSCDIAIISTKQGQLTLENY